MRHEASEADRYWPEVDGLRAVAVGSVVAFHVGFPFVPGGYVGVDIFFVISGFLITGLLYRELLRTHTIDLVNFYGRRSRRILPAFALVVVATLALGAISLTAVDEQQNLASSSIATVVFASNVFFWRSQVGYFAEAADQMPLLHMWTLSVEEQFYLAWPILMMLTARLANSKKIRMAPFLGVALVGCASVSFAACSLATSIRPQIAFFLTPFRAWEFALGGLVAIGLDRMRVATRPRTGFAIATAGLVAIGISILCFDQSTLFPGYAAALPVSGAVAVIIGALSSPNCATARLLRTMPMVGAGKLSYSLYLWHWPLLAIARASSGGEHSLLRDLGLAIAAVLLSAITYRFVEQPFRGRAWPFSGSRQAIVSGVVVLLATGCFGLALNAYAGWQLARSDLLAAAERAKSEKFNMPPQCVFFQSTFSDLPPAENCTFGGGRDEPMILLWGDSHAFHFIPAFAKYTKNHGLRLLPRAMGYCRPSGTVQPSTAAVRWQRTVENCTAFNNAMRSALPELRSQGTTTVALAARWSVPPVWASDLGDWKRELSEVVDIVRRNGMDVILIADVPGHSASVPQCVARNGPEGCSRSRTQVASARAPIVAGLREIAAQHDRTVVWDPIDEVCGKDRCEVVRDGVVLYSDDQHLSVAGSEGMSERIGDAFSILESGGTQGPH
jgi:peptidoglycan/LPS O-acetylase OafA/YrhL